MVSTKYTQIISPIWIWKLDLATSKNPAMLIRWSCEALRDHLLRLKWNCRLVCLWSKMSTFQTDFLPPKNVGLPMPTPYVQYHMWELSNEYCMTFYLKGHQKYQNSKLKFPKSLLLLTKVESSNLQVVAVLMPLEIKRHIVPHLKALICTIER